MPSKKSKKNKKKEPGFGVKATVVAEQMAKYIAKYNAWRKGLFEEYIRQNADPKVEGEITDDKLKAAGIYIVVKGEESWLEQNGKVISKVLKPKGYMIFCEPNMLNPYIFVQKHSKFIKKNTGDSPTETAYYKWQLKSTLKKQGFTQINIKPIDYLPPFTPNIIFEIVFI